MAVRRRHGGSPGKERPQVLFVIRSLHVEKPWASKECDEPTCTQVGIGLRPTVTWRPPNGGSAHPGRPALFHVDQFPGHALYDVGPVMKTRPAGAMIMMSVSAGPYAAAPAAGPDHHRDLQHLPRSARYGREHLADPVHGLNAVRQLRPARMPYADHGAAVCGARPRSPRRCTERPRRRVRRPSSVASVQYAIDASAVHAPTAVRTSVPSAGCRGRQLLPSNSCVSRRTGSRRSWPSLEATVLPVVSAVICFLYACGQGHTVLPSATRLNFIKDV